MEERSKGLHAWRDSQGLASKLYSFKHGPGSLLTEANPAEGSGDSYTNGHLHCSESDSTRIESFLCKLTTDGKSGPEPDLKEQAIISFLTFIILLSYLFTTGNHSVVT